jgi:pyruvate/2-oxoglutarate dehydrogenase complex dihydrolipoamide dehydrogenase (E3) component
VAKVKMKYDYDVLVIGLGPAGMAVAIMGAEMGLRVCAIEKHRVGGECMNVGCIPSKALLRMAQARQSFARLARLELAETAKPAVRRPFARIRESLAYISEKKTMGLFQKVHLVYQQGPAAFVDPHTVAAGGRVYTAKRIFLGVGTRPELPGFPGLSEAPYLTNETLFALEAPPPRLIVVGGGAIACEMAQGFARLGSQVTMILRGPRLLWREDQEATALLEATFAAEGIRLLPGRKPLRFENAPGHTVMHTDAGEAVEADRVLVAAGRRYDFAELHLERAGVVLPDAGAIRVNKYLQTSARHVYGVGDCNGHAQLSHAAMHQGMIAIMNSLLPGPLRRDFRRFAVPWTVFTEPQFSQVGWRESALRERGVRYETIRVNYADYGAAIAEGLEAGFVKVFASRTGRIYGAYIIGEGAGEMINEWALAVQQRVRMHAIMMLQHSFPTMGFLSKRAAESWMMNRMQAGWLRKACRLMFG